MQEAGGEGKRDGSQRREREEKKPRPGPDNEEPQGLRRGVGDISQIRTDHKPLDAIQFCEGCDKESDYVSPINSPASRRRLPSHKSTHDKLCSSTITLLHFLPLGFPLLPSVCTILSVVRRGENVRKGIKRVGNSLSTTILHYFMGVTHVNGLTADVPESVRLPHLLEEEVEGQEEHRRLDCCWAGRGRAMGQGRRKCATINKRWIHIDDEFMVKNGALLECMHLKGLTPLNSCQYRLNKTHRGHGPGSFCKVASLRCAPTNPIQAPISGSSSCLWAQWQQPAPARVSATGVESGKEEDCSNERLLHSLPIYTPSPSLIPHSFSHYLSVSPALAKSEDSVVRRLHSFTVGSRCILKHVSSQITDSTDSDPYLRKSSESTKAFKIISAGSAVNMESETCLRLDRIIDREPVQLRIPIWIIIIIIIINIIIIISVLQGIFYEPQNESLKQEKR
ncbi:hypothetical protein EYF80_011569 [Liparis tanakae]|uniref:Uncharacterized protein n=1 Tax=Liparis tanakae TaxID=230148 RepID=A0A4Z2IK32_9TELE|nr:hypothetical protein EYF80_011569 [Liparis tanakae]